MKKNSMVAGIELWDSGKMELWKPELCIEGCGFWCVDKRSAEREGEVEDEGIQKPLLNPIG